MTTSIPLNAITFVRQGLCRPECVVVGEDGTCDVSDGRGGITAIRPDGPQRLIARSTPVDGILLEPNSFDRLADGSFIVLVDRDGAPIVANGLGCLVGDRLATIQVPWLGAG